MGDGCVKLSVSGQSAYPIQRFVGFGSAMIWWIALHLLHFALTLSSATVIARGMWSGVSVTTWLHCQHVIVTYGLGWATAGQAP